MIRKSSIGSDTSWENVKVLISQDSKNNELDFSMIQGCYFMDQIVLSPQSGFVSFQDQVSLPASICRTTFRNCYLFPNIAVYQNVIIENTIILPGSIVIGNSRITCQSTFLSLFPFPRASDLWKRMSRKYGK